MSKNVGTYALKVPTDDEVAEVPLDLEELATSITNALNGKLAVTTAGTTYQPKIQIIVGTTPPATAADGTIVFLVTP